MSRLASAALGCVLVGLAIFTIGTSVASRNATNEAHRASLLSDSYEAAARSLSELETIALTFIADPSHPEVLAEFDPKVNQIMASLTEVDRLGDASDHALMVGLGDLYYPKLNTVKRYFDSLREHRPFTETLPDRATVEGLRGELTGPAAQRKAEAQAALAFQLRTENVRLYVMLVVYLIGIGFVSLLLFAIRVSGRREALAQLEIAHLSKAVSTDGLTGLQNHRAFLDAVESYALSGDRGVVGSLAVLDLDGFKETNDRMGHEFGDDLLKRFSTLLQQVIPGSQGLTFRTGGDEFAILLPQTDLDRAATIIDELRAAAFNELNTSISAGITEIRSTSMDARLVREEADWALYEAKRRGRNGVVRYEPGESGDAPLLSSAKMQALARILNEGTVDVLFQPIRESASGTVFAYEALSRQFVGLSGPQEAFDLAERSGHASALDRLCRTATLAAAGKLPATAMLFINISPTALAHPSFVAVEFEREVRAAGLEPARIVVEITERSPIQPALVAERAHSLRAHGFKIALDDVGAGNAGLEMLRIMPVDFVKVDHSVLTSALTDATGNAVLVAIVAFATSAGARVIAEGVESAELLALVRSLPASANLAIDLIQGYLVGKPAPLGTPLPLMDAAPGGRSAIAAA